MSNIYPFGQWIIGDLGLVGLGGGAFTTGFLLYIFRNDKLEPHHQFNGADRFHVLPVHLGLPGV